MGFRSMASSSAGDASLRREYQDFFMGDETFVSGYRLADCVMILTDRRILFFESGSGPAFHADSLYLDALYHVSAMTSGFSSGDTEIQIDYICSPRLGIPGEQLASRKFTVPGTCDVQTLYRTLQELAYNNFRRLNG